MNSTPVVHRNRFKVGPGLIVIALLLLAVVVITLTFFERLPLLPGFAIDWQSLYLGLQGGHIVYKGGSVMIAPWSLPAVVPLGFLSLKSGWGMLTLMIITVLVL